MTIEEFLSLDKIVQESFWASNDPQEWYEKQFKPSCASYPDGIFYNMQEMKDYMEMKHVYHKTRSKFID